MLFRSENPVNYSVDGTPAYDSGTNTTVITFTPSNSSTITKVWLNESNVFTPDPSGGPYRLDWQFDAAFSPQGGDLNVFAHPGYNLQNIDNGVTSQVLAGPITAATANTWNFTGLSDSEGQNPTYQPISVDGGVCVLYPFIFVYGSHGFIANNNVSSNYEEQNRFGRAHV